MAKADLVQLKHPRSKRYVKIDKAQGKIIGTKSTPYKNIKFAVKKDEPINK